MFFVAGQLVIHAIHWLHRSSSRERAIVKKHCFCRGMTVPAVQLMLELPSALRTFCASRSTGCGIFRPAKKFRVPLDNCRTAPAAIGSLIPNSEAGRDGALRRPRRRAQRQATERMLPRVKCLHDLFRPLRAGGTARCPYRESAMFNFGIRVGWKNNDSVARHKLTRWFCPITGQSSPK